MTNLNVIENLLVHFDRYLVHIVIGRVVHDGVGEHEHDVALELSRRFDRARLDKPLERRQVHGAQNHWAVAGRNLVFHRMHEYGRVSNVAKHWKIVDNKYLIVKSLTWFIDFKQVTKFDEKNGQRKTNPKLAYLWQAILFNAIMIDFFQAR